MKFKLVRSFLVILTYLAISIFFIFMIDSNESHMYVGMDHYTQTNITIDTQANLNYDSFGELIDLATNNNVTITKNVTSYDSKRNIYKDTVYTSAGIVETLDRFQVPYTITKDPTTTSLASTSCNEDNCSIKINDVLQNSDVAVKDFSQFEKDNGYIYGSYSCYYEDDEDFGNFIEASKKYGANTIIVDEVPSNFSGPNAMFVILPVIAGLLFILSYIILEIFNINNDSKKISVMKLLGFNTTSIYRKIVLPDLIFYIILIAILSLVVNVFVAGLTVAMFIKLFLIYCAFMLVFMVRH